MVMFGSSSGGGPGEPFKLRVVVFGPDWADVKVTADKTVAPDVSLFESVKVR